MQPRRSPALFFVVAFALFVAATSLGASPALSAEGGVRKARIKWREVDGAEKYDFQLSKTAEMDPLLKRQEVRATGITLRLPPGTYYFRMRGIDGDGSPGPWSEVQGFVVNANPPELLFPRDLQLFKDKLTEDGIEFRWKSGLRGSEYKIEIRDDDGVVLERAVDDTNISWLPPKGGVFSWRVGFETASRTEWSKPRKFKVSQDAVTQFYIKALGRDPAMLQAVQISGDEEMASDDSGVPPSFWFIARLAQSIVAYNFNDIDAGANAGGVALVSLYSGELRWSAGRSPGALGMLSGSLNFELMRQSILGTPFTMPRGYARFFYTMGTGAWRAGPLLHVNGGVGTIFIVEDADTATTAKVTRFGGGLGGVFVYRAAPSLGLSALGLVRMDMGGSAPELPNPLSSAIGFEAGFGLVFNWTKWLMLEGRLRVQQEGYRWTPAAGGSDLSSMQNTFIIIDIGAGYKF